MQIITTSEMLSEMQSGDPFSLTVVKYDRERKTGGQKATYEEAILVQKNAQKPGARPATDMEAKRKALMRRPSKDPSHRSHYTRNIQILQNGHPTTLVRKIHPPLVIEFNNKIVVP